MGNRFYHNTGQFFRSRHASVTILDTGYDVMLVINVMHE